MMSVSPLRVLVVEDEMMVILDLEDMLEELGHVVAGVATRIDQALDLARSGSFDLAVLDINVAGEVSFPVAILLQQRGVPVIFASGYDAQVLPEEFRRHGLLQKPFRTAALQRSIQEQGAGDRNRTESVAVSPARAAFPRVPGDDHEH